MHDPVVAIDVEVSGSDPVRDEILHIGAIVSTAGGEARRFGELVRPSNPLSPGVASRVGISAERAREARDRQSVAADLASVLAGCPTAVSFRPEFAAAALRAAGGASGMRVIDLAALARLLFPRVAAHSLFSLADALGIPPSRAPWALARCELALAVWARLVETARQLPSDLTREVNHLLSPCRNHPAQAFFRDLAEEQGGAARSRRRETAALEDLFPREGLPRLRREEPDPATWTPLDLGEITDVLGPGGTLAAAMANFEYREQQAEMTAAVVQALNESKHLLVEAGTGVGKSLAYLLPAVLWAVRNRTPVIISTNTKNLQSQLFTKDLPLLQRVLPVEFRAAVIRGRGNYLCLRKLFHLLRHAEAELDREERVELVRVLVWAAGADSGDLHEIGIAEMAGMAGLHLKLASAVEECRGAECRYRQQCFLQRARRKALAADVVVANHAVVFSEMGLAAPVLPPYAHIVFDEAHNLEEAATSWLSVEVSLPRMRFMLGRLWKPGRRGKGTGLIPSILRMVESGTFEGQPSVQERLLRLGREIEAAIEGIDPRMSSFGSALADTLGGAAARESRRFTAASRAGAGWQRVPEARDGLLGALKALAAAVEALGLTLTEMTGGTLFDRLETVQELQAVGLRLAQLATEVEFVLAGDAPDYVYWVGRAPGDRGSAYAVAAPIHVGQKLAEELYAHKASVIFTSATLSVHGSMDFLSRRIGVDRVEEGRALQKLIGTPFDFPGQCAVLVPMFLPEPEDKGRDYATELGLLLAALFRRTRGRGMCLFTSYDMLRRTTAVLQREMDETGIQVLAQGSSGSRENITEEFKRDVGSVLMGTHSFWEGVDVVGESLSCLVLARLPFGVITDPVLEARCEQVQAAGGNAFMDYQLPQAVIRFRQGFGRLIRSRSDRGVVIVADRRIRSKHYGRWFREAIPVPAAGVEDSDTFIEAVGRFLEGG